MHDIFDGTDNLKVCAYKQSKLYDVAQVQLRSFMCQQVLMVFAAFVGRCERLLVIRMFYKQFQYTSWDCASI